MTKYLLRRLIVSIPVLIGITMATYLIMNMAPGDPVDAMLNPEAIASLGPGWVEQQREALGLNDPVPIRYAKWVQQAVEGNLGFSYIDRQPVLEKVTDRLWPTLKLMLTVLIISLLIGVPVGIISAVRQYSFLDYFVTVVGMISVSIPAFFLALVLIYFFALRLDWLPATGMFTVGQERTFADSFKHLILPATALGLAQAAPIIRYTRASLLEVISQDYTTVARAKGLSERSVIIRHALRNVLIPLVTVVALDIPRL